MRLLVGIPFVLALTWLLAATSPNDQPLAMAQVSGALYAAYYSGSDASAFHNGKGSEARVSVRFNQPVAAFSVSTPSVQVDGGTLESVTSSTVDLPAVGSIKVYTFILMASGDGSLTFRLARGKSCAAGGICGSNGAVLWSSLAPRMIPGPVEVTFEYDSYTTTHSMPAQIAVSLDTDPLREVAIPLSANYGDFLSLQRLKGVPPNLIFGPGETRKTFRVVPAEGAAGTVEISFGSLPPGLQAGSLSGTSVGIHDSEVWKSILTVGTLDGFRGYGTFTGETEGTLTLSRFSWRGTEYTVNNLLFSQAGDKETVNVELEVSPGFGEEIDGLTLSLDGLPLNLVDGRVNARQFFWSDVELLLNEGETVDVELRESHPLIEYRSSDGRYNNAGHSTWGQTRTELLRMATASYADRASISATWLPSPRLFSNEAMDQSRSIVNSARASSMLWQWGQFLDHDISHTPAGTAGESLPIPVPAGDPVFDPFRTRRAVLPFTRSQFYPGTGTGPHNPREQINNLTAFIDASQVYGSDRSRAYALRANDGTGMLMTSGDGDLLPYNEDGLDNDGGSDRSDLFLSGDVRVNEQTGLAALHTLFLREHNRLAGEISENYPAMTGDQIYEIARKIVGAQMQVITYNEFLPKLLGPRAIEPYAGYDPDINSSIANEFSTAAFRVGHTMLPSRLLRVSADGRQAQVSLADVFFRPSQLETHGISPFLRGLVLLPAEEVDLMVVDEVRNLLFRGVGRPGVRGTDLAALNIQRTRDHGLASFNLV